MGSDLPVGGGAPVLVTGATGFTGGRLVRWLVREGYAVRALVRTSSDTSNLPPAVERILGDLGDPEAIGRAVAGAHTVFHVAAAFRDSRLGAAEYERVNVSATAQLVRAAAEAGVARMVHCSTGGVHGHVEGPPADEDAPFAPGDYYQDTKLRGELAAREIAAGMGLPLAVARLTGVYGPGDRRILTLIRSIARGRFVMVGSGQVRYHLTYVDDVVDGLMRCALRPDAAGRVYILAGPEAPTLDDLVVRIARAAGTPPPRFRLPVRPVLWAASACEAVCRPLGVDPPLHRRRADFFVKNRAFDTSRARRELDFAPRMGLDHGLRQTCDWYRSKGWL
jgi:dihydroflavonol-4-reductase